MAAIALLAAGGKAVAEPWVGVDSSKPPRLFATIADARQACLAGATTGRGGGNFTHPRRPRRRLAEGGKILPPTYKIQNPELLLHLQPAGKKGRANDAGEGAGYDEPNPHFRALPGQAHPRWVGGQIDHLQLVPSGVIRIRAAGGGFELMHHPGGIGKTQEGEIRPGAGGFLLSHGDVNARIVMAAGMVRMAGTVGSRGWSTKSSSRMTPKRAPLSTKVCSAFR